MVNYDDPAPFIDNHDLGQLFPLKGDTKTIETNRRMELAK